MQVFFFIFFLFTYSASLAFWLYLLPIDMPPGKSKFSFFWASIFKHEQPFAVVTDAHFDIDYFALQRKPHFPALIVDDNSVVVIKSANNQRKVLCGGTFDLKRGSVISHIFDLRPGIITVGPKTDPNHRTTISRRNAIEKDSHSTTIHDQSFTFQTADGAEIAALFDIFYRLKYKNQSRQSRVNILALSALLERDHQTGNSRSHLEAKVGSIIAAAFRDSMALITLDDFNHASRSKRDLISFFQSKVDSANFLTNSSKQDPKNRQFSLLQAFELKIVLQEIWIR